MTQLIKPAVGKSLWYYHKDTDPGARPAPGQPLAAIIVSVWTDTCVTIAYFDAIGAQWSAQSVLLVHGDNIPAVGGYAVWMTCQKEQAKQGQANGPKQIAHELPAEGSENEGLTKFILPTGSVVKVGGIPVRLDHPCVAWVHPANMPEVFKALRHDDAESGCNGSPAKPV